MLVIRLKEVGSSGILNILNNLSKEVFIITAALDNFFNTKKQKIDNE